MEVSLDLKDVLAILKKRLWIIISFTFLVTVISAIISYFVLTPTYSASTQILVNQSQSTNPMVELNDIKTNLELINTYGDVIKSPAILGKVADELSVERSYAAINSQVTIVTKENSQVFGIRVVDQDPAIAVELANKVTEVFQREIPILMNVDNVNVLAAATYPSKIGPNEFMNMAVAFTVGLLGSVLLIIAVEIFNNKLRAERDIERLMGLSSLGTVNKIKKKDLKLALKSLKRVTKVKDGRTVGGEDVGA